MPSLARRLLGVSRPYFWLVTAWLYLLPTGRRSHIWSSGRFWTGALFVTLPLNMLVYLMNDLADVRIDTASVRKRSAFGGVGSVTSAVQLRELVPYVAAAQVPFALIFTFWLGLPATAGWFSAMLLVNWAYNFGPRLSSRAAPLDLLCPCGYMLVIPLSCELCDLPLPPRAAWAA